MTSVAVPPGHDVSGDDEPEPAGEEVTFVADSTRASIRVRGDLTTRAVRRLDECLELHLASGRRFVRVSLAAVDTADAAALELFARVHHALLARRGTLILTGVGPQLQQALARAGLDQELFVVGRFADDLI